MAKFIAFFAFKPETIEAMVAHPSDRVDAIRRLVSRAGGTLESYYWMQGPYDGFAIIEVPSAMEASAISLVATASGAFVRLETHELIEPGDMPPLLSRVAELRQAYSAPGVTSATH
ncbi:MAG TPA: GYD domain-containing protein [Candidatus Acidoferrum sp.]|jgi:uncharacterized protein with GYD domain|nr:GYD domain-containing protein [Candidatus Acidoferrum sp.]